MDICIDVYMQCSVDYFRPGSHALLLPTYRIPILPFIAPSLTLAIQMSSLPHYSTILSSLSLLPLLHLHPPLFLPCFLHLYVPLALPPSYLMQEVSALKDIS